MNELYATLTKKNADIYIQRSKQLYSGAPLRSRLVRWHFEQFELLALADPSYHGTQRVVELIQHLDPERSRLLHIVCLLSVASRWLLEKLKWISCSSNEQD